MAFCSNCGLELNDGAYFCHGCGKQVNQGSEEIRRTVFSGAVHKCPQCGEVLNAYEGFCSACGHEIRGAGVSDSVQKFAEQLKTATTEYQKASIIQSFPIPNNREDIFEFLILATSSIDKHLNKAVLNAWKSKIEQSYHKARLVLRQEQDLEQVEEIYEEAQEKLQELTFEKIENKKMPSLPRQPEKKKQIFRWTPMTTIGMALGVMLILMSLGFLLQDGGESLGTGPSETVMTDEPQQNEGAELLFIEPGKEYTYGSDGFTLFVARAISDSVIKIDRWDRGLSLQKGFKELSEIGVYKINDPEHGFSWLNSDHTAFKFIVKDKNTNGYSKGKEVVFTIAMTEDNVYKGANCIGDVRYYEHQHGNNNLYKAVVLADDLLKIECWTRSFSITEFYYSYDLCVIDLKTTQGDFCWSDEDRSSFTLTMQDKQNYSLKKPVFVVFEEKN